MKPLLLIICLALTTFAQNANEGRKLAKWELVAEGPLVKSYYSQESIKRAGDIIKVWMRFELPKGSSQLYADTPIDFGEVRIYGLLDCTKNSAQVKTMMVYDRNSNFYASKNDVSGWTEDKPDSISHAVFEFFCERSTGPPTVAPTLKPK